MQNILLKLLLVISGFFIFISAEAKVEDSWKGDFRQVRGSFEKYKSGYPPMKMSIERRIKEASKDTVNVLLFHFYTFSTDDESFRNGDKIMIRLGNNEIVEGKIYYIASPKASVTSDGRKDYVDLPDRLPGYSISTADYHKLAKYGIKKVRINHSHGFFDYEFNGKDFDKFNKKFLKNYLEVNSQVKKAPPYRPIQKSKAF